jgi:hypothetical protein
MEQTPPRIERQSFHALLPLLLLQLLLFLQLLPPSAVHASRRAAA